MRTSLRWYDAVMTQPPGSIPPPPPPGPPPGAPPPPPQQQRGWFGRNWKWFVPLVIVLPIVVCCGGITAIVGGVFGMIKSSEPYKHALAQAQTNPQVTAALGTPIEAGFFAGGNINLNNNDGDANLVIPVKGPKGSGTVVVVGKKNNGLWTYETLEFVQTGSQQRIDLRGGP